MVWYFVEHRDSFTPLQCRTYYHPHIKIPLNASIYVMELNGVFIFCALASVVLCILMSIQIKPSLVWKRKKTSTQDHHVCHCELAKGISYKNLVWLLKQMIKPSSDIAQLSAVNTQHWCLGMTVTDQNCTHKEIKSR